MAVSEVNVIVSLKRRNQGNSQLKYAVRSSVIGDLEKDGISPGKVMFMSKIPDQFKGTNTLVYKLGSDMVPYRAADFRPANKINLLA